MIAQEVVLATSSTQRPLLGELDGALEQPLLARKRPVASCRALQKQTFVALLNGESRPLSDHLGARASVLVMPAYSRSMISSLVT